METASAGQCYRQPRLPNQTAMPLATGTRTKCAALTNAFLSTKIPRILLLISLLSPHSTHQKAVTLRAQTSALSPISRTNLTPAPSQQKNVFQPAATNTILWPPPNTLDNVSVVTCSKVEAHPLTRPTATCLAMAITQRFAVVTTI